MLFLLFLCFVLLKVCFNVYDIHNKLDFPPSQVSKNDLVITDKFVHVVSFISVFRFAKGVFQRI